MKKHIIILFIMTLFAGMTLSAQEDETSAKKAKITEIKRSERYYYEQKRNADKEVAGTEARHELKKQLKNIIATLKPSEDDWETLSEIIDENVHQIDYVASGLYSVFVYVSKSVLTQIPGAHITITTTRDVYESHTTEVIERTPAPRSNNAPRQQTETIVQGPVPEQEVPVVESVPPQEELKPVEVVPPQEEPKPVVVEQPKVEPKPVEVEQPKVESKSVEVEQPKVEPNPVEVEQPKTEHTQIQTDNTQLVEVMPDVPESAVKLSSSSEVKYAEGDTTGITEFMRAVINCRSVTQVSDLVTNYQKDGAGLDYKQHATSKDTDYYLVIYKRGGKLEAILSPSAKGEVVNILTGEPDGLQNHPGTSLTGFKINVE
ncbi:MAG: hypothetical protein IKG81_13475 [Bacteroidales bacterium]|nr:hypothetical protein [Bacteroidales bacterium]